jgi:hypothetical protein
MPGFTNAEVRFAGPFVNPDFQIMKEITRMEIESMLGEMD